MDRPDKSPNPNGGKRRNSGRDRKNPERNPPSNLFWYLMIAAVVGALLFSVVGSNPRGEEIRFSEFMAGLKRDDWNSSNVHELTIGDGLMTFQSQPAESLENKPNAKRNVERFSVPTVGISDEQIDRLSQQLEAKGIPYGGEAPPSEWQTIATLLVVPMLFLLLIIFVFRRLGGAGRGQGEGLPPLRPLRRLRAPSMRVGRAVRAVAPAVWHACCSGQPGKYQALGGRIPRGVLLVGPPGTGKTLLAKAVAGEAGVPFFSLSGSDFVEMFVGVGAARVRDMFQQAVQRSPAIIFIDELDALGKVRGSGMPGGHDEREQTLNALLVEMDGFSSDLSVIVMGATNRPETLDPALLRPGRFDRHVLVDRPDIGGRESILKVHAAKIKMDDSVNLTHLAKLTPGFVGADLANLVNEAALLAARKDRKVVSMAEFEEGIERVVAGLEKHTRIIHQDEKQRVAYHECGHALVACVLPHTDPVHKISIIPRGLGALGYTLQRPEDEKQLVTQSELTSRICVLLGGIAAEEIIYRETSTGAQNDLERATDLARRMVTDFGMSQKLGRVHYSEAKRSPFLGTAQTSGDARHSEDTIREIDLEVKRIVDEASATAYEVLSTRRELLEHLTRELLECEVMDASRLKSILDTYKTGPQIKPGTFASHGGTPASTGEGRLTDGADDEDSTPHRDTADGA